MAERQIGNYRILKQIGAGGMARVYLAVHESVPNLRVVLKILSNPQHAARFIQEADKLAQLDRNPNICHIKGLFYHEDELVIAMEYIDGKTLEELIAEKGRLAVQETIPIITDLLTALQAAHERAIYHRDIKPSNIMFERDGQLKIIDFGIAKGKTDPQITIEGTATGTPEYMAPEQFECGEHVDYARCDIYAVGTILYRMLTGRLPFEAENQFILRDKKLSEDPATPSRLNPEVPEKLSKMILRSIDKDPGMRFSSVAEMKSALLKVAGMPTAPLPAPGRKRVRNAAVIAVGVIVAAAALYVMLPFIRGLREKPAPQETKDEIVPPVDTPQVDSVHRTTTPSPSGIIRIWTAPRGAYVYIDGIRRQERTPYDYYVPPGKHVVKTLVLGRPAAYDTVMIQSGEKIKIGHNFQE